MGRNPSDTGMRNDKNVYRGIGVSPGIRIGEIALLKQRHILVQSRTISADQVEAEVKRFNKAVSKAAEHMAEIRNGLDAKNAVGHRLILEAHEMLLRDEMLGQEITTFIRDRRMNAEWALKTTIDRLSNHFGETEDEVFQRRANDIVDVGRRVMENLTGVRRRDLRRVSKEAIVVAHNITPGDASQFYSHPIRGVITESGGKASHMAIISRSMEIPAVLGVDGLLKKVKPGDKLIIDGGRGIVVVNPNLEQMQAYLAKQRRQRHLAMMLHKSIEDPAITLDGERIGMLGNIESVEGLESLQVHGAEGVGLFRTEFLYMNRPGPPSEEEHYRAYRRLAEGCTCGPVTIRTLDVGGDKLPDYWPQEDEENPALGCRAVRTIYKNERYLIDQVRGIYRAAVYGEIRMLLPFISGVSELELIQAILKQVHRDLQNEGVRFNPDVPLGIMIELPSAAVTSDILAKRVDFFSIGTNDLVQYTLAVDRDSEQLSHLYDPLHPAILRLLKMTCDNARKAGIPVALCGEMASDPIYTLLLLGLGMNELDMPPAAIPYVKEIIRNSSMTDAREMAEAALALEMAEEVEQLIIPEMERRYPELLEVMW